MNTSTAMRHSNRSSSAMRPTAKPTHRLRRRALFEGLERRDMMSVAAAPETLVDRQMPNELMHAYVANAVPRDDYADSFQGAARVSLEVDNFAKAQGTIERRGDVDMFTFRPQMDGRIAIKLTTAAGSRLNTQLRVFNEAGKLIAEGANKSETSQVVLSVPQGTKCYAQTGARDRSIGAYTLQWGMADIAPDDYPDDFAHAPMVNLSANGRGTQVGMIEKAYDTDLFRFVAPVSGQIIIRQESPDDSNVDPFLRVYNQSGKLLAEDDESGSEWGGDAAVACDVVAGRTYYVRAAGDGRSIGQYTIQWTRDDFENTFSSASTIALTPDGQGVQSGVIERIQDVDFLRFVAPTSGHVNIVQFAADGGFLDRLDTHIYVYNQQKQLIAGNHEVVDGCSRVDIDARAGEVYYVKATGNQGSCGDYLVQVSTPRPTNPQSQFHIELMVTGFSTAQRQMAEAAAERWEQIIVGDLPDLYFQGTTIDDVLIRLSATPIDGPGSILGWATPPLLRNASGMPYYGEIELDSADVSGMADKGSLEGVLIHEIGHTLGFGATPQYRSLLVGVGTANPGFTGRQAVAEYNAMFHTTSTAVPIEAGGGSGTALSHWRESVFDTELMTGYYNSGPVNALSRITVAALADLGYIVDMRFADPYVPPPAKSPAIATAASQFGQIIRVANQHSALEAVGLNGSDVRLLSPPTVIKEVRLQAMLHDPALSGMGQDRQSGVCVDQRYLNNKKVSKTSGWEKIIDWVVAEEFSWHT